MSDIKDYQEPLTGAVSIFKNPGNNSTQNPVLFTCVAYQLELLDNTSFPFILLRYASTGWLLRAPGTKNYTSWDDLVGMFSSIRWQNGETVKENLLKNFMRQPDGNFLGRFVVLDAMVFWPLFPVAAIAYLWDMQYPRSNQPGGPEDAESGRQLLWLAGRYFWRTNWLMRPVIWLWRKRMMSPRLYRDGLKSLFKMYYKPDPATGDQHPFIAAARGDFR